MKSFRFLITGLAGIVYTSFQHQILNAQCDCPGIPESACSGCPRECPLPHEDCDAIISIPSRYSESVGGYWRVIRSNGVPNHPIGFFPLIGSSDDTRNCGRPNAFREQEHFFVIPAHTGEREATGKYWEDLPALTPFGVAINGVPFDPDAAEWWKCDPASGWTANALQHPCMTYDTDCNHGHVQPTGAYHYHGVPTILLERVMAELAESTEPAVRARAEVVFLGWAFDGAPIYGPKCFDRTLAPPHYTPTVSWRLKGPTTPPVVGSITLPGPLLRGHGNPPGRYNGDYVEDFVWGKDVGDLDRCNGHTGWMPDFRREIYHYHITEEFPYVPRCYVRQKEIAGAGYLD